MMMYYLCRNKILYHECYLLFENTYLSHIYHYFGKRKELTYLISLAAEAWALCPKYRLLGQIFLCWLDSKSIKVQCFGWIVAEICSEKLNSFRVNLIARYPYLTVTHLFWPENGKEPELFCLSPKYMRNFLARIIFY